MSIKNQVEHRVVNQEIDGDLGPLTVNFQGARIGKKFYRLCLTQNGSHIELTYAQAKSLSKAIEVARSMSMQEKS